MKEYFISFSLRGETLNFSSPLRGGLRKNPVEMKRFNSTERKLMARSVTGPYRRIVFSGFVGSDPRADRNISFKNSSP